MPDKPKNPAIPVRVPDPDYARAMVELARSNASGAHIPAPRKGSRGQRRRDAIRDGLREG